MERSILVRAIAFATVLLASAAAPAEPPPAAVSAFNSYAAAVESRLAQQHRPSAGVLAAPSTPQAEARLRRGDLIVEQLTPRDVTLPGAMLHHWRATAFAPGATAAGFDRLMRDLPAYPQHFAPQVLQARLLSPPKFLPGDEQLQATMRVRQHHILTVVLDTAYDITFSRLDGQRGATVSRSTRIAEIDSPGTPSERALPPAKDHGFLWRQNTYWTYEERDGGLYLQVESLSLSRSIPTGLAWAVRPFVESVPREALEFTLRSTCNALRSPKSATQERNRP